MSIVMKVLLFVMAELVVYGAIIWWSPLWGSIVVIVALLIALSVHHANRYDLYYVRWQLRRQGAPEWLVRAWVPLWGTAGN